MQTKLLLRYFTPTACLALLLLVFISFSSCKKFLAIDPPKDQLVTSVIFSDDSGAVAAMAGLYSSIMTANNNFLSVAITQYAGLSAGEIYNTAPNANADQFFANAIQPSNSIVSTNIWRRAYGYIYHANAIITGLGNSNSISTATRAQLTGEAKIIRSLCYFYLSSLFGDVPLVTTPAYETNAVLPRASAHEVMQQVAGDLSEARDLLQLTYPSAGRVRPNSLAASALLARVYLFLGHWANAEAEATRVISNPGYTLVNNLNNVFLAASTEPIWQFMPVNTIVNTWEGNNFIPSSATVRPPYALSASLLSAFEAGDLRKTAWTKTNVVSSVSYTYPFKYKVRTGSTVTEHYTILRLAEQYLIRAEARAHQDNFAGARADLNIIRSRAGLAGNNDNSKEALLLAIEKERQVEFAFEWGHRWLDLKRTGRINTVLSGEKPSWQPHAALYPVPQAELEANPFLTQNPGY
jgi:hypothetical protein